jgi:spore maturation protein CgeB
VRDRARLELRDSDVGIVGSYFPDATAALAELFDSSVAVKAFYDIDTPVTLSQLRETGRTAYLTAQYIPAFDIYFSFTGGPLLSELRSDFGAKNAVPLYCSVDIDKYQPLPVHPDFRCAMSYMGTYAPDRQPKMNELLSEPARLMPNERFFVAGPQYPDGINWPGNVLRIEHLEPRYHPHLYSSSRLVLNITRRDMVMAGYSPSVRLFEAAACGAPIVSDNWPGLSDFFQAGSEILLAASREDSLRYLRGFSDTDLRRIGEAARSRILADHSSEKRALQFEHQIVTAGSRAELRMTAH